MPTYEYLCSSCGKGFERFESITARPNKTCLHCGKKTAQRQISAGGGLLFKGSGFYTTDYRSKSYKAGEKSESTTTSEKCSTCAAAGKCPAAGKD